MYRGVVPVQEVADKALKAQKEVCSEVRTRLMELDQRLGVIENEVLPLVQGQEVEESLRGNHTVLAGVETCDTLNIALLQTRIQCARK